VPFGLGACVTFRDLIAYCRLAIFRPHPKVKAPVERRGSIPRRRDQREGSGTFARGGDRAAIRPWLGVQWRIQRLAVANL